MTLRKVWRNDRHVPFYYANSVPDFLLDSPESILGTLTQNSQFDVTDLQRNTWIEEIRLLKRELAGFGSGTILFEFTIPRVGQRIDNVFLYHGHVFLIEFKVGASNTIPTPRSR